MPKLRYQDIYPSPPALNSADVARRSAAELLTLEYFEAEPAEMPKAIFDQHHVLLNLNQEPHRVENWRDGEHRDFIFHENEVVVTPAGVSSGWRWHAKSQVIVITLEPEKLERFAKQNVGVILSEQQLTNHPQFSDPELVQLARSLRDALEPGFGSAVMFESLARIFLVKLLHRCADREVSSSPESFSSERFQRVLAYIADNFGRSLTVEDLSKQASMSPYHFSRLFKESVGESPYQFLMAYRVERAKERVSATQESYIDIALSCGFSDQAHFSRVFKKSTGMTPKTWRDKR